MDDLPKNKHLQVFLEVAKSGGIMSAARSLHMTQPSVTRIIKELETYLGMSLFQRTSSGVSLNRAGTFFHNHVLGYVNGLRKSIDEIRMEFGKNGQSFSLGYSSLVGYTILPDIISEFKNIYKDISLNINEGQLSSLLPLVNSGAIDCAIGTISDNGSISECYAEKLFQSQFSVFSSPLHPLARAKSFSQLASAKWVLPETQFGYYHKLNDFLEGYGIDIRSAIRTDSISSILNLVTCANYLTILASPMGEGRNKKLALHKISVQERLPTADYYFVWSKKFIPSILLERFMAIIKERCTVNLWGA